MMNMTREQAAKVAKALEELEQFEQFEDDLKCIFNDYPVDNNLCRTIMTLCNEHKFNLEKKLKAL